MRSICLYTGLILGLSACGANSGSNSDEENAGASLDQLLEMSLSPDTSLDEESKTATTPPDDGGEGVLPPGPADPAPEPAESGLVLRTCKTISTITDGIGEEQDQCKLYVLNSQGLDENNKNAALALWNDAGLKVLGKRVGVMAASQGKSLAPYGYEYSNRLQGFMRETPSGTTVVGQIFVKDIFAGDKSTGGPLSDLRANLCSRATHTNLSGDVTEKESCKEFALSVAEINVPDPISLLNSHILLDAYKRVATIAASDEKSLKNYGYVFSNAKQAMVRTAGASTTIYGLSNISSFSWN